MKNHNLYSLFTFLLLFVFNTENTAQTVTRGPYLQLSTPNSIIVKWRTSTATNSKVWYGLTHQNLNSTITVSGSRTDHEIEITGLSANTTYYYAVGDNGGQIAGGDSLHYFITSPSVGSTPTIRIWVLGDAGRKNTNQRNVRDGYYNYIGTDHTDMILALGDNAYDDGLDSEYQLAWFENMYEDILINTVVWSCPGNHDIETAGANSPYWDIFNHPTNAEAGGDPSGTESYYSFDYGNIHVISLDAEESDRSPGSAMLTWLQNDLNVNTLDWTIVIFHNPPYAGLENEMSDTKTECIEMRENVLPILESGGVDLVLTGNAHNYHRSWLIEGHYGYSNTFDPATMVIDGGDGRVDGDGAYTKATNGPNAGDGTVYVVTGSAGRADPENIGHAVDYYSDQELGSTYIEVTDDQMDVVFVDDNGNVDDYFTIQKIGVVGSPPTVSITSPADGTYYGQPQTITIDANASDSDGTIDFVNFKVDGFSVGIDSTAPYSVDWTIPSSNQGYTLTAVAKDNDDNSTTSAPVSIFVGEIEVCSMVSTGSDDAEEHSSGNVNLSSSDLELGVDGTTSQIIGLRFDNLDIPQGANIVSAAIQFTVDEVVNVNPFDLTIYGEDSDDAVTFSSSTNDVSNRPLTTASVTWSPPDWLAVGDNGAAQKTVDISSVIQEIVDRPNFSTNSAIAIIIDGVGTRIAESYNGEATSAPKLCVSYGLVTYDCPAIQKNYGDPCDDNDICTINDEIQNDCSCAGTFQDSDGDGTCDALDVCPGGPEPGTACDDGDPNTSGEVILTDCTCAVPDCPSENANFGFPCDDNDVCTINDEIQNDCSCAGTFQDSDGDGVCDALDVCPGAPDPGASCDDNDVCTINDEIQPDCSCAGTFQDSDGDGVCDALDVCPGGPEPGTPCDDGDPNTSGETIQPDCSCGGGVSGTTICVQVNTSSDDAEEDSSGNVDLYSSDLELINNKGDDQTVGMRFVGLNIPQGANILAADIQFTVDETTGVNPCDLDIYGEDSDDATSFTNVDFDVSNRTLTSASVSWSPPLWTGVGDSGPDQLTPNIASVIQEIVDRNNFNSNSAIAIIMTGTGKRTAESYNGSSGDAATLCVTYDLATYDCPAIQKNYGDPCDDNDVCTTNDEIQNDCSCAGTFQDSDGDGVCDALDVCPGGPEPGTPCDDGDPNTSGEIILADCSCAVPDCPAIQKNFGDPCDDNDVCTINDEVQNDCSCAGTFQDSDGDGVCDALDVCPGAPDPGASCDDNDVCTINDEIQPDCSCAGTFQDSDGDGVCDALDVCPGGPEPGTPCDDGDPNTSGETIQADCSCGGGVSGTTVCVQVGAGTDDAEERPSGSVSLSSSDLELVEDGGGDQTVGMRFLGHNIPQGANILSADIQFTVDETNNINPCNLDIYGEDSDDAVTFSNSSFNITNRPFTTALVSWLPPSWTGVGDSGPDQLTPNIAPVVQEIVDRPNYTSSSAIAIIMTGTGKRTAESYNGSSGDAATLCVTYDLATYDCPAIQKNFGDPCDDNDVCTTNDEVQNDCSCAGTFQDSDGDGVCDALDVCPGGPEPGTPCDDGDPNTSGEIILADCTCAVPDCPAIQKNFGDPCDDNDVCTINDEVQNDCSCAGTFQDSDGDGVCDALDVCPGAPDPGASCDDNDVCTINDEIQPDCSCAGTFQDSDGDGVCDALDVCPGGPEPGTPCDDGDPNTSGETIQADCSCGGGVSGTTVCVQIGASKDDAEEDSSGSVDLYSSDLELVDDGGSQTVGMRFLGHNIPQGANILSADIQFTVDETTGVNPCDLDIYGEDSDDAIAFSSSNNNLSNRALTTASVSWSPLSWTGVGDSGPDQLTPNIASVIQEIVDRNNFNSNSAIAIIMTGTGKRTAESYNGSSGDAATLCVTYDLATYDCPAIQKNYGDPCDDNDVCTTNDEVQNDCSCAGTFQDSDGDGVCDALDVCPGGPEPGTPCDDGDPNTSGEIILADCTCAVPDCPAIQKNFGDPCDDNDVCTINDEVQNDCSCAGTFQDSDGDGVCDALDVCPGAPDPGASCDDNDVCTINDEIQPDCSCAGTFQDSDGDGVCDALDVCPGGPEPGTPCDDGDPNTSGETIQADCSCGGGVQGGTTTCAQVSSSFDDAEERSNGTMSLTSSDLELVEDGGAQTVGMRFVGLNIPQGATILKADLQFTADEANNVNPCTLDIYGEDVDDAGTYTSSVNDLTNRSLTTATVSWSPSDWTSVGDAGPDQLTPDLSAIIQEIVDRNNYTSASAIALIFNGSGKRVAESFNGSSNDAPELCIEYVPSAPLIGQGNNSFEMKGTGEVRMTAEEEWSDKTVQGQHTITVYPNPTTGNLTVSLWSNSSKRMQLQIRNLNGSVLKQYPINVKGGANAVLLDELGLPAGIYFVQCYLDGHLQTARFVMLAK